MRADGDWALRLAGLAISAAAALLVVRSFDLGATAQILGRAALAPLGGVLVVGVAQVTIRTIRWQALLPRPAGRRPPTLARLAPVLLIGYLGNVVLPARLGEAIRAFLVARREQLGAAECFGVVVLEQILDTATLAVIAFAGAVWVGAPAWITQISALAALGGGAIVVVLVTTGLGPLIRGLRWSARRFLGREPAVLDLLDRFAGGLDGSRRRRVVALAALISAAAWVLDMLTFWLVARSLGVDLTLAVALLVAAITVLSTAVPAAPGYVGTFELAAASAAGAFGIPGAEALALALLAHAMTVIPIALAGATALLALGGNLGSLAAGAETAERSAEVEARA